MYYFLFVYCPGPEAAGRHCHHNSNSLSSFTSPTLPCFCMVFSMTSLSPLTLTVVL
jgi:hypothetical protein